MSRRSVLLAAALALTLAPTLPGAYADLSKGRPPLVLDARVGPNLRLGDDPEQLPANLRGQAEPHLIRSATDPNLLLATFQEGRHPDGGAVSCGYAVSRDGGLTWRRALVPGLASINGGRFNRATDPVAGAGPQGELYLQNLGSLQGAFDLAAVVVSRSLDGGTTWTPPVTVFESTATTVFPDKNWLAVNDHPAAPASGRLVSSWTTFIRTTTGATISASIVASVSDDRGATWSAPINVTPANSLKQGSLPLFLPDGTLVLVYITFLNPANVTTIALECKRSLDGGRTFPTEPTVIVPRWEAWDDPQMRDGVFLPSAAVARQSGDLFVTYAALAGGTPRVWLTRSSDHGATWSPPLVISDQPAGISVMNPTVAASPDGRTVAVFFMDKRDAPHGRDFVDFYATLSFDGGLTWQPNFRLSSLSSEIRYGPPTPRGVMLGDYFAVVPAYTPDQPFVALWCDTRTGDSDPFAVRFAPRAEASFDAWRMARFTTTDHAPAGRSSFAADPDGDGLANIFEYYLGLEPLVAEHGDVFAVQPLPDGSHDLAWARRPNVADGPLLRATGSGDSANPRPGGPAPAVAPPVGLAWQTTALRGGGPATASLVYSSSLDTLAGTRFPEQLTTGAATALRTDARLVNLSTRARVGGDASPLIMGFVLEGPKTLLLRAAGPALGSLGLGGSLPDPRLTLHGDAPGDLTNDNWNQGSATAALFARLGAFPFPVGSLDAALAAPLDGRSYTAVVTGTGAGLALVEAYDAEGWPGLPANPRLLNLSSRGEVAAGDGALIAGFTLTGTQPRRLLLRAVGPSLAPLGVAGALADPALRLFRDTTLLAANDDWEVGRSAAAVAVTAARVGAFALPRASLDAALVVTLAPGSYTIVVTGADLRPGVALLEIYDAD